MIKRLLDIPNFENVVEQALNTRQQDTPMYQVCERVRNCRIALLKLKGMVHLNFGQAIREIKGKMEVSQLERGARNWSEWRQLQQELGEQYRKEEVYWCHKFKIQWLQEGDQNTKFFHAYAFRKRRRNCIEKLVNTQGNECNTSELIEELIAHKLLSIAVSNL